MLSYLLFTVSSRNPIALDDTYHNAFISNSNDAEFLIQPFKKAALLIIAKANYKDKLTLSISKAGEDKYDTLTPVVSQRVNDTYTYKFTFNSEDPSYLKMSCSDPEDCDFTYMYVHTEPVYTRSAAIGSFALFINLFLFIFAWTVFCGACRATRKR